MNTEIFLGGYNGHETRDNENKEFVIKIENDGEFNISDIIKGQWNTGYDSLVEKSLKEYVQKYFPKYLSSGINGKVDLTLNIGVNDDGEITGCPFSKKRGTSNPFTKDFISKELTKSLVNIKKFSSDSPDFEDVEKDILDIVDINIVKLKIDKNYLSDEFETLYEEYKKKHYSYVNDNMIFNEEKRKWIDDFNLVRGKIENLLNCFKGRNLLIDYIKKNCKSTCKSEFIDMLSKEEYYIISNSREELEEIRLNKPDNILHWLLNMRDDRIEYLYTTKPVRKVHRNYVDILTIISRLSELRYKLCDTVDYYMIQLKINGEIYNKKKKDDTSFYFENNGAWIYRKRIGGSYGPSCSP